MNAITPMLTPASRACALLLAMLALAGCGSERLGGFNLPGSNVTQTPAQPSALPVSLAGRWLLSSPGLGQCHMTFRAASPSAVEGAIAPEGGCPGKFFTSRRWVYDQAGLTMRDHNGQPLAQLSDDGGQFNGTATSGEPVTLMR